jgi:hypothetical protein
MATRRDMVFCVLFVGDVQLIRHLVLDSARRLGALEEWAEGVRRASLVRLRVMFFLLMDRDPALKQKLLDGWPDLCVVGVDPHKANAFFRGLGGEVIDPWLVDERRCEDEFVSGVTDLYLVS